jgi:hypothetical protein
MDSTVDTYQFTLASLLKHGEPVPVESSEEQFIGRLRVTLEVA